VQLNKVSKLFMTWDNCLDSFRQDIRQLKKERRNETGDVTSNKVRFYCTNWLIDAGALEYSL